MPKLSDSHAEKRNQPLSEKATQWLMERGTPNMEFVAKYLNSPFLPAHQRAVGESLKPYHAEIVVILNDVTHDVLNAGATADGPLPTRRMLGDRLRAAEAALPEKLHAMMPVLSEPQIAMVAQLSKAWRIRVLQGIENISKDDYAARS